MPHTQHTRNRKRAGHTKRHSLPASLASFNPDSFSSLSSLSTSDSASDTAHSVYTRTTTPSDELLVIVASDGVHLEAPYAQVCAASRALADVVAHFPCGWDPERSAVANPQIHLYHEYENGATVGRFLELVTTGALSLPPKDERTLIELAALVRFLRKYQCVPQLAVLMLHVRVWLGDGALAPLVGFVCGAMADDEAMCVRALSVAEHEHATNNASHHPLEPGKLPVEAWYRIPHHYLYALTRALGNVKAAGSTQPVEMRFKGHLREAKRYYGYEVPANTALEKLESMEQWRG